MGRAKFVCVCFGDPRAQESISREPGVSSTGRGVTPRLRHTDWQLRGSSPRPLGLAGLWLFVQIVPNCPWWLSMLHTSTVLVYTTRLQQTAARDVRSTLLCRPRSLLPSQHLAVALWNPAQGRPVSTGVNACRGPAENLVSHGHMPSLGRANDEPRLPGAK